VAHYRRLRTALEATGDWGAWLPQSRQKRIAALR
jgi:hypothetical protein